MALIPQSIKALFSKLAPYVDDVAKGVANYGDDVARGVATYGDDIAKGVANYGDDVLALANVVGGVTSAPDFDDLIPELRKARSGSVPPDFDPLLPEHRKTYGNFMPPATVRDPEAQLATKTNLVANRLLSNAGLALDMEPTAFVKNPKTPRVLEPATDAATHSLASYSYGKLPTTTQWLGDVAYNWDLRKYTPASVGSAMSIPRTPMSQLVMQHNGAYDPDGIPTTGIRPHKNTRLGKWFAENNPDWDWRNDEDKYWLPF